MAHELDFSKGFAAIAYRGDKPWHGYGAEMPDGGSIEEWRKAAGLEYAVESRPVTWTAHDATLGNVHKPLPSHRALVRNDNQDVLSVVSKNYKVVQPAEVLDFFRDLVDRYGFEIETAGALAGGKRVWALAKTGQNFTVGGVDEDKIEAYLLLATSYDAKFATTGQYTGVRVVCNNTLSWSLQSTDSLKSGEGTVFRVTHSQDFKPGEVKANLGILEPGWERYTSQIQQLANTPVTKRQAVEYFMELMGYKEEDPQYAVDNLYTIKKLLQSYETAPGQQLETSKDTAWGLVNAVTYFTDHTRKSHDRGSRINSAWFGQSAVLKRRAFTQAIDLAEAA